MTGMTTAQRKTLAESIKQWGDSQTRIQAEKDHQDSLAAILKDEMQISPKHFKKVAMAYWNDTVKKDREDTESQLDLFEFARGFSVVDMPNSGDMS